MRQLKLFYSWQSDIDSKLCKNFVRTALDEAAHILNNDKNLGFEIVIDSDTQGVPGTPPVNETILQKIRDCDVFVPDVTFVAEIAKAGKRLPNPNVMAEYGYALHAKTHAAMLPVMNTAFGPPEELPFDMHHLRHPKQYDAPAGIKDEERRKRRKRLAEEFASELRLMIEKFPPASSKSGIAPDLMLQLKHLETRHAAFPIDAPAVVSQPRCELMILSANVVIDGVKIDPRKIQQIENYLVPVCHDRNGYRHGATNDGWWWMGAPRRKGGLPNPETQWLSYLGRNGVIKFQFTLAKRVDDDPTIIVWGQDLETQIATTLDTLSSAAKELRMEGPALICFLLDGMEHVELLSRQSSFSQRLRVSQIHLPDLPVNSLTAPLGNELCPVFDSIWLAAGKSDGSPRCKNDRWLGYSNSGQKQENTTLV